MKQLYIRIENDNFGFVTNEIHEIKDSDILISETDYNTFFELQTEGKQFRLKEVPIGKGLFDYVEEFVPAIDTSPHKPTQEERITSLELALLDIL